MSVPARSLVWDLPTRLFHWSLVVLVGLAYITAEAEDTLFRLHELSGYSILVLLLFRLLWGFAGNRHARFRDFVRGWTRVRTYTRTLLTGHPENHAGHNPLGGWMILALLGTLATITGSGFFAPGDGMGEELHEGLSGLLLALIGVHLAGVLLHSLLTGENLVRAMWTGRKQVSFALPEVSSAPLYLRAGFCLALALGATWWLITP